MFDFGLSYKDWSRIAWTFVQGVLGYATAAALEWIPGQPFNVRAFVVGALAAGFSFVKNFVVAENSPIK